MMEAEEQVPINEIEEDSLKLSSFDALIYSPFSTWSNEKLIESIELLTSKVNQDKSLYLSVRRKLVALHLTMNRRKGPSPALRSAVKVLPRMAYDGGLYPFWAKAASNDKQLIDLDFVLQKYAACSGPFRSPISVQSDQ